MGWRFRKSIGILPGVRVNISKSGLSTSLGERGASINVGRQGTRGSVGLPGTGLSYGSKISGAGRGWRARIAWILPLCLLAGYGLWHIFVRSPSAVQARSGSVAASAPGSCACGTAECVGPRGGHYCLTSDGRKRYAR